MSKNIIMQQKTGNTYSPYYSKNNAQNVIRLSKEISYIDGNTLLEVVQNIANTYIAPHGEIWQSVSNSLLDNNSVICGYNNFICILTPYNQGEVHQINMIVSFDGGMSWNEGYYSNSNINFRINYILGAEASLGNDGLYEVVFVGIATSDATEATTYKAQFKENSSIPYVITKFNNQIDLMGGDE